MSVESQSPSLYETLVGVEGSRSIGFKMRQNGSRTPTAVIDRSIIETVFPEENERIVGISPNIPKVEMENVSALGGWCAIRTIDSTTLRQGELPSLEKEKQNTKVTSVSELTDWISQAISIDQCIEAVYPIPKVTDYVSISEAQLWSERIFDWMKNRFPTEQNLKRNIRDAVDIAEQKRLTYTTRYLLYVTKNPNIYVTRFTDEIIVDDLVSIRNEMLTMAGTSVSKLQSRYPNEQQSIPGYSLVWTMYTGLYLNLLQEKGVVKNKIALISEPWFHATSETDAKNEVTLSLFGTSNNPRNEYLNPKGINAKLGFIANYDILNANSTTRMRVSRPINTMPNELNYQQFIQQMRDTPQIASLTLQENPAFIWGVNLLPYETCKKTLYNMIALRQSYKKEMQSINASQNDQTAKQNYAQDMKTKYKILMENDAQNVIQELERMMIYVFTGRNTV